MRALKVVSVFAFAAIVSLRADGVAATESEFVMEPLLMKLNATAKNSTLAYKKARLVNATKTLVADVKHEFEDAVKAKLDRTVDLPFPQSAEDGSSVPSFKVQPNDAQSDKQGDASSNCWDETPPAVDGSQQYSCEQQKSWNKCGEGWMFSFNAPKNGWCAKTCGRC